ncbi:MAG: prepilin peptidase [Actinobacteria bacterium]|nr:MAG: prepilin peptidase [Actinomycetota bacterium]
MAFYYAAAFVLGLVAGSFANVVIYRVPLHKSIVYPPSQCPNCSAPIAAYDNVPLLSYLLLRGKCRRCSTPISLKYPAVELASGLLFAWSAWTYGFGRGAVPSVRSIVAAVFLVALLTLAVIDLEHRILPNVIVLPLMIFGLATVGVSVVLGAEVLPLIVSPSLASWQSSLLGFALGGGVLLLLALLWRGGMGGGDIKLMAGMGLFLGPYVLFDLFVGVFLGSIAGIYLLAVKKRTRKDLIPFGPFLVAGAFVTLQWGEQIVSLYLKSTGLA